MRRDAIAKARHNSQTLSAEFPDAEAVFVVGEFNHWSTTATPMRPRADGLWEAEVPADVAPGMFAFFVWQPGALRGRLDRREAQLVTDYQ